MKSFRAGMKFEHKVSNIFKKHGFNVLENTGGSLCRPDVSILVDDRTIHFECKSERAFEGGASGFDLIHSQLIVREPFFARLIGTRQIWGGRVPQFKLGNTCFDVWRQESKHFKAEWIDSGPSVVAEYYKLRGVHYIIIENTGIFHTGEDPLRLGCVLFSSPTRIRIRCKQHSSSSLPTSVQASLIFKKVPKQPRLGQPLNTSY